MKKLYLASYREIERLFPGKHTHIGVLRMNIGKIVDYLVLLVASRPIVLKWLLRRWQTDTYADAATMDLYRQANGGYGWTKPTAAVWRILTPDWVRTLRWSLQDWLKSRRVYRGSSRYTMTAVTSERVPPK